MVSHHDLDLGDKASYTHLTTLIVAVVDVSWRGHWRIRHSPSVYLDLFMLHFAEVLGQDFGLVWMHT